MILQHFFSNLLSKITSLKCNTTLLYRIAKMLFGPYFHEKTWSAASYCSLKVTKPPESFKIEAKYEKVSFLWQGLIPGLLCGSQVSQPLDQQGSDEKRVRCKKNQFKFDILFEHFPYISQPLCQVTEKCSFFFFFSCLFRCLKKDNVPNFVCVIFQVSCSLFCLKFRE